MKKSPVTEKFEKFFMSSGKKKTLSRFKSLRRKKRLSASVLIHNQDLSLVVIDSYNGVTKITKIIQEKLPDDWFEDGELVNDEGFSPFIKSLCQKNKLKTMPATLISDNTNILPRIITVPKKSAKWIAQFLQEEVKKYVLFSGQDVKINWKIIETVEVEGKPHYRVFVVAIRSDIYSIWHERFKKSGLYLRGISTHSIGLEYILSKLSGDEDNQNNSQIVVSIEPNQTLSFYMLNGAIHALHVVPLTANNLVDEPESLEYLEQVLKKTNRNLPDCPIVYFCSCLKPEQAELLKKSMSIIGISPIDIDPYKGTISVKKDIKTPIDAYLTAIGAGEMSADDMLLVDLSQGKPYLDVLIGYFMITMGLISATMLTVFFVFYSQSGHITSEIYEVQTEYASLDKEYQTVVSLDKDIAIAKKVIVGRRKMFENAPIFNANDFFKKLPTLMTDDLKIDNFKLNGEDALVITGEAFGPDAVFAFLQEIKKSPYFLNPDLKEVIQDPRSTSVKFVIHSKLGAHDGNN